MKWISGGIKKELGVRLGFIRRNRLLRALLMSRPRVRYKYLTEARKIARMHGDDENVVERMLDVYSRYHLNFDEYYAYRVWEKSPEQLAEIIGDYDSWLYYISILNQEGERQILDDKFKAYQLYKDFYKREVIIIGRDDVIKAAQMLARLETVIVKVNGGSCGRGVQLLEHTTFEDDLERFFGIVGEHGSVIVEERMKSQSDFSSLHPLSLNTVRVHTIRLKKGVLVIHPYVRIGRGDKIVDNAGSGGVFAPIDVDCGCLSSAVDEFGNVYDIHPDTHVAIKGFRVPQWTECVAFARRLADVFPANRFVGWDIALTTRGWCMIEGNFNPQLVFQMCNQKGCRSEFNELMRYV